MHHPPSTYFPFFFMNFINLKMLFRLRLRFVNSFSASFQFDLTTTSIFPIPISSLGFLRLLQVHPLSFVELLLTFVELPLSFVELLPLPPHSTTMYYHDSFCLSSFHIFYHKPLKYRFESITCIRRVIIKQLFNSFLKSSSHIVFYQLLNPLYNRLFVLHYFLLSMFKFLKPKVGTRNKIIGLKWFKAHLCLKSL